MDTPTQNVQEPIDKKAYTTPLLMEHGTVETLTGMSEHVVGGSDTVVDQELEDN